METFIPVFQYEFLRILFAIVFSHRNKEWKAKQCNVKNVFLNSHVKEEVLIEQLNGFERGTNSVLIPLITLYPLKQSPWEWHNTLCTALAMKGIKKPNFDPSIFMDKNARIIIVKLVEDLVSIYTNRKEETDLFHHWENKFQMTEEGAIDWMVRINMVFSDTQVRLIQSVYLQ